MSDSPEPGSTEPTDAALDILEIYRSGHEWRWRRSDAYNGNIVAASTEGFVNKDYAIRRARRFGAVGDEVRWFIDGAEVPADQLGAAGRAHPKQVDTGEEENDRDA